MSCVVCESGTLVFNKCPHCQEPLCTRNSCSSKCSKCREVQCCRKCFEDGEDNNTLDWESRGLHYEKNYYLRDSLCGQCDEMDVGEDYDGGELLRCECLYCGERVPELAECEICDKKVCDKCMISGDCHM